MPKKNELSKRLEELSDQMADIDASISERLSNLAAEAGTPLAKRWQYQDIENAVGLGDLEQSISDDLIPKNTRRAIEIANYVRNVFILLPILFTWVSFWFASINFRIAIEANPELRFDQFLILGERVVAPGIKFFLPVLTFADIAIVDALLIATIVGITIATNYLYDTKKTEAQDYAKQLSNEIKQVLWKVPVSSPGKGTGISQETLSSFLKEIVNLYEYANQTLEMLEGIKVSQAESISKMEEQISRFGSKVGNIQDYNKNLNSSVTTLGEYLDNVRKISEKFEGVSSGLDNMTGKLSEVSKVGDNLERPIAKLEKTLTDFSVSFKAFEKSIKSLSSRNIQKNFLAGQSSISQWLSVGSQIAILIVLIILATNS